jgi:hypothetical protein
MSIEKFYRQFTPVCDCCGERIAGADSFDEAVRMKREAGWKSRKVDGEWEDICTDCQFEEKGYDRG